MNNKKTISYFKNKSILITGGTDLLEKLLLRNF